MVRMADTSSEPPASGWQYKPDAASGGAQPAVSQGPTATPAPVHGSAQEVTWTASEFIAHHKGAAWYLILLLIGALFCAIVYLLTRDLITLGVILLCFLVFGISAARKPRVLAYRLDANGLTIGQRLYPYETFKAFALVDEGSFTSIAFVPLKRFRPPLSIYFAPEDEDRILEVLTQHLPLEPGELDLFETLMRRVRF
jgi:hypothetical protein